MTNDKERGMGFSPENIRTADSQMIIPKKPRRVVLPYVLLALTFRSGSKRKKELWALALKWSEPQMLG